MLIYDFSFSHLSQYLTKNTIVKFTLQKLPQVMYSNLTPVSLCSSKAKLQHHILQNLGQTSSSNTALTLPAFLIVTLWNFTDHCLHSLSIFPIQTMSVCIVHVLIAYRSNILVHTFYFECCHRFCEQMLFSYNNCNKII